MSMTDPIADMLTRIRNASRAGHEKVDIPASKLKQEVVRILKEEGYIKNFKYMENDKQGSIRVYFKPSTAQPISKLRRVSRPGLRVYVGTDEIPRVLGGLGIAILSTPQGVMTGHKARRLGIGGEFLCSVW